MDYGFRTESGVGLDLSSMLGAVTGVIANPLRFFKDMPKSGGFAPPVIFTLMMALIACAFQALLSMLGLGFSVSFPLALAVIVIFPALWAIFSFSCAAFWYFIWWLMGSRESFETAYRCVAYASAISPITSLLFMIPYLGAPVGFGSSMCLVVIASIEVHKIATKKTWIVFGSAYALRIHCQGLWLRGSGPACAPQRDHRYRADTALPEDVKLIRTMEMGVPFVTEVLWERSGIGPALRKVMKEAGCGLHYEKALLATTANRLCESESKLGVWDRWCSKVYMPSCGNLKLHQMYEALDLLQWHIGKVEDAVFFHTANLFNLVVDLIFYDTTTASLSSVEAHATSDAHC